MSVFQIFHVIFLVVLASHIVLSQTDPIINSWVKSTGYTGYNNALTNVNKIQYSSNFTYISCSSIPSYSIGPWSNNPNTAKDQNFTFQFSRYPKQNDGTKIKVPLGHVGLWANGVGIFNADDGMSYNNSGIWRRNAYYWEGISFDSCYGHPDINSEYHHHVIPVCLFNYTDTSKHSPLIGFAFDGFPVYGPFAYTNASNSNSAIKRIKSSYKTRNITTRTTLVNGTVLTAAQYGPDVSSSYPIGCFLQDYEYVEGLGDLDEYNGRYGITPEYPNGTYAYFVTTDSNGVPAYPFVFGPYFYGTPITTNFGPSSGKLTISEAVSIFYDFTNTTTTVTNSTSTTTTTKASNRSSFTKSSKLNFVFLLFLISILN